MRQSARVAQSWVEGPSKLDLSADRVDIWQVNLTQSTSEPSAILLSSDELTRARRFHFEKDSLHFSHCRSALRILLSGYVGIPAAEIRFVYQPNGKPELAREQNSQHLRFNVSHSAGLALIAVSADHRLGIDIEKIRTDVDVAALAAHFFSKRERSSFRYLPDHLRVPAFFSCWARKESFLKATGDGLSVPLSDFSVLLRPDVDPVIEEIRGDTNAGDRWALLDLKIDGYCATVAIEGAFSCLETYVLSSPLLPN